MSPSNVYLCPIRLATAGLFRCDVRLDMPFLEVSNLCKRFASPEGGEAPVVDVESFSLNAGDLCAMRGESGSGKTTFLHLLAGILRPDAGSIILDGTEVTKLGESARDHLRATAVGYVFQSFNLLQGFTCLENVMLAMVFADEVNEIIKWRNDIAHGNEANTNNVTRGSVANKFKVACELVDFVEGLPTAP